MHRFARQLNRRSKLMALDFACLVPRKSFDEPDTRGNSVCFEMLPAMCDDTSDAELSSVLQRDTCHDLLTEIFVGNADHGAFPHFRETLDDLGDRLPVDVVTALNDKIVTAPDDVEFPIFVEAGEVSGAVPSFWIKGRLLGTVEIPALNGLPQLKHQPSGLTNRKLASLRIHNFWPEMAVGSTYGTCLRNG